MEQYISKSALLAEIERLVNNYDKALDYEAALEDVRDFIDTLEVKDIQEFPVSYKQSPVVLYGLIGSVGNTKEEPQVKESTKTQYVNETCKENGNSLTQEPVNEVWHDAQTERPQAKEKILATNEYGDCEVDFAINMALYWPKVIKWAYIEDLLNLSNVEQTAKNLKKPVNDELKETANNYVLNARKGYPRVKDEIDRYIWNAFEAGVKWQAEQFEKNRLAACDRQAEEEAEIERDFVMGIIENEHRQPTYDDAIKYGMRLQKEQMMTKSIEAVVSQVPCSNEIIFYNPSSVDYYYLPQEMNKLGLNKGDKVKLIIIKEG